MMSRVMVRLMKIGLPQGRALRPLHPASFLSGDKLSFSADNERESWNLGFSLALFSC